MLSNKTIRSLMEDFYIDRYCDVMLREIEGHIEKIKGLKKTEKIPIQYTGRWVKTPVGFIQYALNSPHVVIGPIPLKDSKNLKKIEKKLRKKDNFITTVGSYKFAMKALRRWRKQRLNIGSI